MVVAKDFIPDTGFMLGVVADRLAARGVRIER